MKSISFVGIVLLIISGVLFYLTTDFAVEQIKLSHIMGIMAGIGIGLIFGGMVGYVSKGSAMREAQKRQEYKQLQKDKEALEKQAAEYEKMRLENERIAKAQQENTQNY